MSRFYFLLIFLLLNIIWLFYIWRFDTNVEEFSPKYISSSFDDKLKIKFKSKVLQSISPYLYKLFPSSLSLITSHIGDIPIGSTPMNEQLRKEKEYNISLLNKSDIGQNKYNSEYEIFLDENKTNIYILKFHINYNYLKDYSLISLYTIPIDNFIITKREEYDLNKSAIIKLWEKKFQGIIKKYSISQDKKFLGILMNTAYKNKNYIKSVIKYIEIFNISNIDEIYIEGNIPLINLDIAKDIIAISRKGKEFVDILIKNKTSKIWEEYDINELNNSFTENEEIGNDNSKIIYYNRINSFKILDNNETNLSLLELYISINNKGIYANEILIEFDKINFTSSESFLLSVRLDQDMEDNPDDKTISYIYDIKSSLSQLRETYFHNSIYSKNNLKSSNILNFEFFHRTIVSLNLTSFEIEKVSTLSSGIKTIQSDEKTNNLIVMDNKGKIYYFYRRYLNEEYSDYKIIALDNIPSKFKNSNILASYIETFEKEKTRLLLLMDNSVIISLDFRKIIKRMNRGLVTILISDYFYTIFMAIFNLMIMIIVIKRRNKKKQRINDITNVINNLANIRRGQ
jgi:hypothetical protein